MAWVRVAYLEWSQIRAIPNAVAWYGIRNNDLFTRDIRHITKISLTLIAKYFFNFCIFTPCKVSNSPIPRKVNWSFMILIGRYLNHESGIRAMDHFGGGLLFFCRGRCRDRFVCKSFSALTSRLIHRNGQFKWLATKLYVVVL